MRRNDLLPQPTACLRGKRLKIIKIQEQKMIVVKQGKTSHVLTVLSRQKMLPSEI